VELKGKLAMVSGKMREAGGKLDSVAPEGRVLQMLKLTVLSVSGAVDEAVRIESSGKFCVI